LVLALLFDLSVEGTTTPFLSSIIQNIRDLNTETHTTTKALNFSGIARHFQNSDIYTYMGSFTTPPCTGGVRWAVAKERLPVDVVSWYAFKKVLKFNARYVQNTPDKDNLIAEAVATLLKHWWVGFLDFTVAI
jgi:carbonic anhydrase